MRRSIKRVCSTSMVLLLGIGTLLADNSKISPDLQPLLANPSNKINVIVQYNTSSSSSGGLLGGLLGGLINLLSGILNSVFTVIPAVSATLQPADLVSVSNQSNVSYISPDRPLNAMLDYTAAAVNAPTVWTSGYDGTGVGIAIIDSGIYSHADLNAKSGAASRVVYRQNFTAGETLFDDFGHGTHVAGIAAGNGSSSDQAGAFRTFKGIAPNANLLDLRVLDANGASTDSVVIS
ncbi:MAG: S8 family serine peptidase, partial [Bryobacteraceae bacterium]